MPISLTSLPEISNYFEFPKLSLKGNSPWITASTSNVSSWKVVTSSILSWSFNFSPMIGCSFSRRTKSGPRKVPSTRVFSWANTLNGFISHSDCSSIPSGRPDGPASPSCQCVSLSFCYEELQRCTENLSYCSRGSNDHRCVGVTTQEVEESNTHPDSPGILRLQQAGDPQESKGQPRRIKKTFRFLAIH